ncbi:expressed unknown protein [Seminavis robusta]|uniref:Uncharacterized protein n=1 Tax=Seminavis robusta TaxID=568900 RepID=A0A9N8EV62_9STRA|nr:expressed unknown protein [Seminavis robusta]|eukprot:Sro1973_g308680.1 n/a (355) ;mRNA; r:15936-17269
MDKPSSMPPQQSLLEDGTQDQDGNDAGSGTTIPVADATPVAAGQTTTTADAPLVTVQLIPDSMPSENTRTSTCTTSTQLEDEGGNTTRNNDAPGNIITTASSVRAEDRNNEEPETVDNHTNNTNTNNNHTGSNITTCTNQPESVLPVPESPAGGVWTPTLIHLKTEAVHEHDSQAQPSPSTMVTAPMPHQDADIEAPTTTKQQSVDNRQFALRNSRLKLMALVLLAVGIAVAIAIFAAGSSGNSGNDRGGVQSVARGVPLGVDTMAPSTGGVAVSVTPSTNAPTTTTEPTTNEPTTTQPATSQPSLNPTTPATSSTVASTGSDTVELFGQPQVVGDGAQQSLFQPSFVSGKCGL